MATLPYVVAALSFARGLAWPTVAGTAIILLRNDLGSGLRGLLYRAEEIGPKGVKLGERPQQQSEISPENSGPEAGLKTADATPLPPAIANLVEQLRKNLSGFVAEAHDEVLLRDLAAARVQLAHERTYRLIYGSQIAALERLEVAGSATVEEARDFYTRETADFSDFYRGIGFDRWVQFLTRFELVTVDASSFRITDLGRDFLAYVRGNRLPGKPY